MNNHDVQRMLQECLQGFDAGLTPEECLSAFPQARAELEPLLRQALALRIAYAALPSEEFRLRTREKLMFAAGRDLSRVFAAEPDPDFVDQTRTRFLNAAGATVQEALRDVPPPRLPFWANARRHLLEQAAVQPRRSSALAFGLRSALSAAVVVFAVAIAGAGFFVSSNPANDQRFAAVTELEAIERTVVGLERYRTQGEIMPPGLLEEIQQLALRTSTLYEHLEGEGDALQKLSSLIDRQQDFIAYAQSSGHNHPDLNSAREQLSETEEKIDGVTTAMVETPEPIETIDTTAMTIPTMTIPTIAAETATPRPSATPEATPEVTPSPSPTVDPVDPSDLTDTEILIRTEADDDTLGLDWLRVSTNKMSFVIASTWSTNYKPGANGIATLVSEYVVITLPARQNGPNVGPVVVNLNTGTVLALVDGNQVTLRTEDEGVIEPVKLVDLTGSIGPALYHFLTSLELSE